MPNNIEIGLNFVIAKVTKAWSDIPLTAEDTLEVYGTTSGDPISWKPNRLINTLNSPGIEQGKSYLLNSKVARDLSGSFAPPITAPSGSGSGIVTLF